MTFRFLRAIIASAMTAAVVSAPALADIFTYQGRLTQGGEPLNDPCDFRFQLFDAAVGGNQLGATIERLNVPMVEGAVTADLDFGNGQFTGAPRWLQVQVRFPAGQGSFVVLSPRQSIRATPYAMHATAIRDGGLGENYTAQVVLSNTANEIIGVFVGNGADITALNASNIATGTLGALRLAGSYTNALALSNAANSFVGTYSGVGAGLTNLNASNIATGNLSSTRLPTGGDWSLTSDLTIDGTTMVVLPGSNRVGFGTAAPEENVAIAGGLVIDQASGNNGTFDRVLRFGTGGLEGIGSRRTNGTNKWGLDFYTRGINRLAITNQGQVGIGTLTPSQNLSVVGGINVDHTDGNDGTVGWALRFGGGQSGEAIGSRRTVGDNQWGLDFYTGSTNRMAITMGGDIGIGTTTPGAKLDINVGGTKNLQFRLDSGLVPGINVTGSGANLGVMRLRNAMEVWPSDDLSRAGKVDVRNLGGTATVTLDGSNGRVTAANSSGSPTITLDGSNGRISALNMPAANGTQTYRDPRNDNAALVIQPGSFANLNTLTVNVPSSGILLITATADIGTPAVAPNRNQSFLKLEQLVGGNWVQLTEVGRTTHATTGGILDNRGTLTITWSIPVNSSGGVQFKTAVTSIGPTITQVWSTTLHVMYFPNTM